MRVVFTYLPIILKEVTEMYLYYFIENLNLQNVTPIVYSDKDYFEDTELEYDWVKFEFHFKKSNPDFFSKLDDLHPHLTPNDTRICAFIKLNIPNKQMASLLNINPKSLEMTRYRLRKKLGLAERFNLYNYICSL